MLVQKLRLGLKLHFVEDGTTYGDPENTVSATLFPNADDDPEPWAVNPMGCVIDGQIKMSHEEDTTMCFGAYGYSEEQDRYLKSVMIDCSLKDHSEIIHRLGWQVGAKIADGVAQTPFAGRDFVEGWVHLQVEADDQVARYIGALRTRIRLTDGSKWASQPTKPAIQMEVFFRNPLNSVIFGNILAEA